MQRSPPAAFVLLLLLLLAIPLSLRAQATCTEEGPVLIGEPTEVLTIGPDGAAQRALTADEAAEYQVYVSCRAGELRYASREDHLLVRIASGCYDVFSDLNGNSVSRLDLSSPLCSDFLGEEPFEYSEVLRNGIYQIIYRGHIRLVRPTSQP